MSTAKKTIRIIATSDLHGKMVPWEYALNQENKSGSVSQLATAIKQYRDSSTIVLDAGDTIQDNSADIFVGDEIHPMVQAINALNYDVCVTGNHDYNYGMDVTKKMIADLRCKTLVGNVYDENGIRLSDGYTIIERNSIRIAVIGMVTPNIARWDAANLSKCTVTDPLTETKQIINIIKDKYDVLIGVFHMGMENELNLKNSGVRDICESCPEFDAIISAHEHKIVDGIEINGVTVVQNKEMAQTMCVLDLDFEMCDCGWHLMQKSSKCVSLAGFEEDESLSQLLAPYDLRARSDAMTVVGTLEGDALVPPNEIADIPEALIRNTALIDFINEVQMYYSHARVSAASLSTMDANIMPGKIRKCDMSLMYKYTNALYKLHMTGQQLRIYMEWTASFYNTFTSGDLTISFNPEVPTFNYDIFDGVNYEINIKNEAGNRIENLSWPDGSKINDEDEFDIAVTNYRANSQLLVPGVIYEKDNLPILLEMDIRGDLGGIRELIRDYVVNVCNGTVHPVVNDNWKITGWAWDSKLRNVAVKLLAEGAMTIPTSESGRTPNIKSVREWDVIQHLSNN